MYASPGRPSHFPLDSIDAAIDRFDRLSIGLVHLDPVPLDDLRRQVGSFLHVLTVHLESAGPGIAPLLEREHERFGASIEQVRGLLRVVEGEDHGGHRQALGQYGKILAEALRRHRQDERAFGELLASGGAPGKHN